MGEPSRTGRVLVHAAADVGLSVMRWDAAASICPSHQHVGMVSPMGGAGDGAGTRPARLR